MDPRTEEAPAELRTIRQSAAHALRRFPGALIVAALATAILIHGVLTQSLKEDSPQWMILLTCVLGIPWLYSLSLIAERRLSAPWKRLAPLLIGALTLGLYYLRIHNIPLSVNPIAFICEVVGLAIALHLFAAYAPFLGFRQPRAFWEYNRSIFLRFLLALLFSATLMLGMTLILALLSLILKTPLDRFYFIFSALILGIFNTWFFLAGVPEDFDRLEMRPRPYSRGLKVFAQFVLLPLTVLIGALLAVWTLQKLLSGSELMAAGVGAFLTLGAIGLLTYLLLYPLEEDAKERWLKIFRRGFFLALLPFLAIFLYQAFRLVQHFGWTPPRYYGLILLAWGAALSLYLVLSRRPHIAWIPVSLSLLALTTVTGPWSAVPLTRASQNQRLHQFLGQLPIDQQRLNQLNPADRNRLQGLVSYLEDNYGCEELQPYFGNLLRSSHKEESECSTMDIRHLLQRDPSLPPEQLGANVVNINFLERSGSAKVLNTKGYDLYYPSSALQFLQPDQAVSDCDTYPSSQPICVKRGQESYRVELFQKGRRLGEIDLEPMVQALMKKYASEKVKDGDDPYYRTFDLLEGDTSFVTRLGGKPARIDFEHIRLEQRGERVSPQELRFSLLFQEGV